MMLFLLISGPRQPGNDIDIYLAPLIEYLITLISICPSLQCTSTRVLYIKSRSIMDCETPENPNFRKKSKMVISVKI